ncbi:unknown [Bacteroides clarus CAG:160]|nr:unknown [Bacteroides clarus CAG:160]
MRHICDKKKAPQETCGAFLFKMFSKKFSSFKKCSIIVMYI